MVITDRKGRITWTNDSFLQLCGYSSEEVVGQKPGSILQGERSDPEAIRAMGDAIKKGMGIEVEMINYHKNGSPYWVAVSITPIKGRRNQVTGFLAIERNTTQHHDEVAFLERQVVQVYNALLLAEGHDASIELVIS